MLQGGCTNFLPNAVQKPKKNEQQFRVNDGFDSPEAFFDRFAHPFMPTEQVGQIVHRTEFQYWAENARRPG